MHNLERIDHARQKYFNIQHALTVNNDIICDKTKQQTDKTR